MRSLEKQVNLGEISYGRMIEIINEKHFFELVKLRSELEDKKVKLKCWNCGKPVKV